MRWARLGKEGTESRGDAEGGIRSAALRGRWTSLGAQRVVPIGYEVRTTGYGERRTADTHASLMILSAVRFGFRAGKKRGPVDVGRCRTGHHSGMGRGDRTADLTLIRRLPGGAEHRSLSQKPRQDARSADVPLPRCATVPGSLDTHLDTSFRRNSPVRHASPVLPPCRLSVQYRDEQSNEKQGCEGAHKVEKCIEPAGRIEVVDGIQIQSFTSEFCDDDSSE